MVADPHSETIILEVGQPTEDHNGGQLAFGPDGHLYVALGHGGTIGPAQDLSSLLGSILRVDASRASEAEPYRIPTDNPLVGVEGARGEIVAYGFRNPWRFSFDDDGLLWVADVGQLDWEEINIVKKGGNYGWPIMEGRHCYPAGSSCSDEGLELPIWELWNPVDTCAVIGGPVYSGRSMPVILDAYIYADYCSGRIWGLRHEGGMVTEFRLLVPNLVDPHQINISGFGQDLAGNLYVYAVHANSDVYRLVPEPVPAHLLVPTPTPTGAPEGTAVKEPSSPLVSLGRAIFLDVPANAAPQTLWCQQCHRIEGVPGAEGTLGPDLTNIATLAATRKPGMSADEYIRESIVDPEAFVPSDVEGSTPGLMTPVITDGLTTEQVDALVAFLLTLK